MKLGMSQATKLLGKKEKMTSVTTRPTTTSNPINIQFIKSIISLVYSYFSPVQSRKLKKSQPQKKQQLKWQTCTVTQIPKRRL